MPLNTTETLYTFVQLTKDEFPQSAAEQCLSRANDIVTALAPTDDTDRSTRVQPLRQLAELNYAASEVFSSYAVIFFQSQPPIRIMNVLNFGAGDYSPTPLDILNALGQLANQYRNTGEYWLARCKPVTSTMKAGT